MFNREIGEFHFNQQKVFVDFIKQKDTSGSYLLVGQESIGKRDFVAILGEKILNNSSKVFRGIHPDFYLHDKGSDPILVEDIGKLEEWIFNKPFESDKKIAVIQSAENMNLTAQNKLLKILEEPPDYLFFFLLTSNNSILLPTVDSRCIKINLNRLPDAIIKESIKNKFNDQDLLAAALYTLNGSYDKEEIYTEEFFLDIIQFLKIIVLKDAASIDQSISLIDKFFKMKVKQYRVLNCFIRVLVLILRAKHDKKIKNVFLTINLNNVSSYNITDFINCLENLNSGVKGTALNLRIGLEELILDFILGKNGLKNMG